jgi:hypothetical protein
MRPLSFYDRLVDALAERLAEAGESPSQCILRNPRGAERYAVCGRYPDLALVGPDEQPIAVVIVSTSVNEAEAARWRVEGAMAPHAEFLIAVPASERVRALVLCRAFGVPVSQLILFQAVEDETFRFSQQQLG